MIEQTLTIRSCEVIASVKQFKNLVYPPTEDDSLNAMFFSHRKTALIAPVAYHLRYILSQLTISASYFGKDLKEEPIVYGTFHHQVQK